MPIFLKLADLRAAGLGYSPEHLRDLEAAGKFPRRVQLTKRKPAWLKEDVDAFIAERIAARRKPWSRLRLIAHCRSDSRYRGRRPTMRTVTLRV